MAKTIANVETTQTFSAWLDKTNEFAGAFANVLSVDAESYPTGTAGVNGAFEANTLTVTTGLLTANASANIVGSANVSVAVNVGANVTANTSAIKVGNSTVNSIITSTTASFANIVLTGIITANGSIGSEDQVLRTDGSGKVYWADALLASEGVITDITAGNGLSKGGTTQVPSLAVVANNGITANSTGVFVIANTGLIANTSGLFVQANSGLFANSTGLFVNATSVVDGILPVVRGGTGVTTANGTGSVIRQTDAVFLANTTIAKLVANGALGTSGQVLTANSTGGVYWDTSSGGGGGTGDITAVTAGNGITGGGTSGDVTITVNAQTGLLANSSGLYVNASSVAIGTLPVARGGTGATTFTSGALLKGNGTSAVAAASAADIVAAIGTTRVANATYADTAGSVANATRATASNTSLVSNDNASSGTFYPVWVDSTSGDLAIKISSTKLTFNPSTGVLSATSFSGSGASLTSLDAGNISAGTLPLTRGGTGATSASGARTSLGATTVGGNLFTLTNPSAVTFPRFNADNTVSALSASDFRTAIGAGTSSTTGTVTSVASGNGITGGTITSTGTLSIVANNGLVANTSGLFVQASSGLFANSTGLFVNASSIGEGTLSVFRGGTGASSFTMGKLLKGNGTSAITVASEAEVAAGCGNSPVNFANVATYIDNQNSTSNLLIWTGTQAQYDAIGTKDSNTLYFVSA